LNIAVNLTARQFVDERLLEDVSGALQTTGMDPRLLGFELSQSVMIRDVEATLRILPGLLLTPATVNVLSLALDFAF
jgi:EAL domain-containing protein (putative c-di-GMP-specific phosphodiesterase class I)